MNLLMNTWGFDCKKYVEENLHEESEVEGLEDRIYELEEQLEEVRKAVNDE